jgi:selenocysteine lyase/cysteine desulfurase
VIDPSALARHYSRFRVGERVLLTGHSHQAWPDAGFAGQELAWLDAAELVDDKWDRAFAQADAVRAGFAGLLHDRPERIALGASTHELLVRLLSALPLRARPRLVTTDGEFHTARRQLDRLHEEGIEIARVPAAPVATLADRLAADVTERTAAVLVSAVLFETAEIVPGLDRLLSACRRFGAALIVDAYHALNAIPFSLDALGLSGAYVIGGGYKYCQLGEGNCFLRFPEDCTLRPVITGWYAEFSHLADVPGRRVEYDPGPARFAGATYDPTSHYRAASVFAFFRDRRFTPEALRQCSVRQVGRLAAGFDALGLDPELVSRDRRTPLSGIAGFLALESARAGELSAALRLRNVHTDVRGRRLRVGPAPYVTDAQLDTALAALAESALALPGR